MKEFRGVANAFSIGSGTIVISIPKEIIHELQIDTNTKKTYFNIYTDYDNGKKKIIYELSKHAKRKKKE